jgi:hypothetical protein
MSFWLLLVLYLVRNASTEIGKIAVELADRAFVSMIAVNTNVENVAYIDANIIVGRIAVVIAAWDIVNMIDCEAVVEIAELVFVSMVDGRVVVAIVELVYVSMRDGRVVVAIVELVYVSMRDGRVVVAIAELDFVAIRSTSTDAKYVVQSDLTMMTPNIDLPNVNVKNEKSDSFLTLIIFKQWRKCWMRLLLGPEHANMDETSIVVAIVGRVYAVISVGKTNAAIVEPEYANMDV